MLKEDWQKFYEQISKLIARAWIDNEYKERFISEPRKCIEEAGISISENIKIQVDKFTYPWRVEACTDRNSFIYTIGLPDKPNDLTEEEIIGFIKTGKLDLCEIQLICCC